jgi:3-phosphoshikimate 1-carboxyvinyltransferase
MQINPFNKTITLRVIKAYLLDGHYCFSSIRKIKLPQIFLKSEDVLNTLKSLNKLGIKSKFNKNKCMINGLGLNGFNYKNNITLNAGNSGTLARLILGLLIHSKKKLK